MQNGYMGSFHGKLWDRCLSASWFASLFDARVKIGAWRQHCNEEIRSEERTETEVVSLGQLGVV